MALSGLDIYKLLAKTNCKKCGFPTCLAFAMQLAAKKASLDQCPSVSEEARRALESASQPPIKLITIGAGEGKLEVGNETVIFRHDQTFYHPCGVGFIIEDNLSEPVLKEKIEKAKKSVFERVGKVIKADLVALKNTSGNKDIFIKTLNFILSNSSLNLVLISEDAAIMKEALELSKQKKPLIYGANEKNYQQMAELSKTYTCPLVVSAPDLNTLADLVNKVTSQGATDLILETKPANLSQKIWDLTQLRRLALKKNFRAFGYPSLAVTTGNNVAEEINEAVSYVSKYAGIVLLNNLEPWEVLPLLTVRQDIYTDPQKPSQVEPKIYEIGAVNDNSPVAVTTNFSITYYTVATEVEGSRVPTYIISVDSEGMSVLTAWAAEKFTAEKITEALQKCGITNRVKHKNVILPGYVAVLSGKLEELSGWKVSVGPKEAAGIPAYLKSWKNAA